GPALFDVLFDDIGLQIGDGSAPIEMYDEEDSGVVSMAEMTAATTERDSIAQARQTMTREHQRVQGADHYAVLMVNRRATAQEIDTASAVRSNMVDHQMKTLTEPRDRAKLGELRELYNAARAVLLDERKRAA